MKHLWRNAWLLLAALLLLFTIALAADSGRPEEIRILNQQEAVTVTFVNDPLVPERVELNPTTLVWPHVSNAAQYQIIVQQDGQDTFYPTTRANYYDQAEDLPDTACTLTYTVKAMDADGLEISGGQYELTWAYTPPEQQLDTPSVTIKRPPCWELVH